MLEEPWVCLYLYNLKAAQWSKRSSEWVNDCEGGENEAEGRPNTLTQATSKCPYWVTAASYALCSFLLVPLLLFLCSFCSLPYTRFRVWAQSLSLILILVLGYNLHLPLTSKRQPSLTQPYEWESQHGSRRPRFLPGKKNKKALATDYIERQN